MVRTLDKDKLLGFMSKRKDVLYDQLTRDFGSGMAGRVYEHYEVKYWKEAIERGEFDSDDGDFKVYIIMTLTNEPVDFTFYTSEEEVSRRVDELNGLSESGIYWYISLSGNFRNEKNLVQT